MMEYLLDTNICIYIIKKKPIQVFEKLKRQLPGVVGVSSITLAELQYGVKKSSRVEQNQLALNQFLAPLEIIDFGQNAAIEYGKVRTYLETNGIPIGPLDMLISGHARALEVTLITNNEKEFRRVPELKIENWTLEG